MICQYSERMGSGILAEPFNVFTNSIYIIMAIKLFYDVKNNKDLQIEIKISIGLLFSIGIGSGLFHMFATRWAQLLDVIPIFILQLLFIWMYSRNIISLSKIASMKILIIYIVLIGLCGLKQQLFNYSILYIPSLLYMYSFCLYHVIMKKKGAELFLYGALLFTIALIMRTIDILIYPIVPMGSHFLWHIGTGLFLYLILKVYILNMSTTIQHS